MKLHAEAGGSAAAMVVGHVFGTEVFPEFSILLFQIENLVLLVAAYYIDGGLQCGALFLLHQQ